MARTAVRFLQSVRRAAQESFKMRFLNPSVGCFSTDGYFFAFTVILEMFDEYKLVTPWMETPYLTGGKSWRVKKFIRI